MENTREIGKIGEDIACRWLFNHDFLVVQRNYLKRWGEIDIVAHKKGIIHFIEVKSVTVKESELELRQRPEENVHDLKVRRLKRVIQTYLIEKHYGHDAEFQFHILLVYMNSRTRRARIKLLEHIIL